MGFLHGIVDLLRWVLSLAKPENLAQIVNLGGPWWVGYAILAAIIFSETGLLVGFFLPGDSLLFSVGFLASQGLFNFVGLNIVLIIAAIAGDAVNYTLGRQAGQHVFEKGRLKFVKREHLLAAHAFYEKHGGKAIVLARFVPVIRTFVPFVAGVASMSYREFAFYNITGGVLWVVSMTSAGYLLGQIEIVRKNFEIVVVLVVVVSVLPVALEAWKQMRKGPAKEESVAVPEDPNGTAA
ncbi:MAG: VTT domain-containing protein [Planctomycetia bacterium]